MNIRHTYALDRPERPIPSTHYKSDFLQKKNFLSVSSQTRYRISRISHPPKTIVLREGEKSVNIGASVSRPAVDRETSAGNLFTKLERKETHVDAGRQVLLTPGAFAFTVINLSPKDTSTGIAPWIWCMGDGFGVGRYFILWWFSGKMKLGWCGHV